MGAPPPALWQAPLLPWPERPLESTPSQIRIRPLRKPSRKAKAKPKDLTTIQAELNLQQVKAERREQEREQAELNIAFENLRLQQRQKVQEKRRKLKKKQEQQPPEPRPCQAETQTSIPLPPQPDDSLPLPFYVPACGFAKDAAASVNEAVICYRSRIKYLEAEMAKCKRQLVNYVQDNKELLTHRRLRYHFEQLKPPSDPLVIKSPQSDSGVELPREDEHNSSFPLPSTSSFFAQSGLNQQPGYESFKREQQKQRRLQLKEFMERDQSNDYELPNLCNVYKSKSYHAFGQWQRQTQQSQPPLLQSSASLDSGVGVNSGHGQGHTYRQLVSMFPSFAHSKTADPLQVQVQLEAELRACQEQREFLKQNHLFPRPCYEHMRMRPEDIQEARFHHQDID